MAARHLRSGLSLLRARLGASEPAAAAQNYIIGAFKPPCDIFVTFSDDRSRKQVPIKKDNGKTAMVPAFQSLETIAGEVSIAPVPGKRLEHTGVKIELLGQIELYFDRGNFYDFTSLGVNVLCGVGILSTPYAVKEGGWFGLVILGVLGVLAWYTGILLRRCLDSKEGLETYPDIGHAAFGTAGRIAI